ncbi:hypothetical protein HMPREF3038_02914 [Akkermansia sp. KLE1797]|nr:hypothetical protein HMPREF3038_02914 [Akkermansia sp. KLE1797]
MSEYFLLFSFSLKFPLGLFGGFILLSISIIPIQSQYSSSPGQWNWPSPNKDQRDDFSITHRRDTR